MLLGLTADGEATLLCDGCRFQLKVSIRSTATNYTVNPSFGQIFIVTSLGSRHSLCSCMYMYSFGPSFNQRITAGRLLWRWVNRHSEIKIVRPEENRYNRGHVSFPKLCVCVCPLTYVYMCRCKCQVSFSMSLDIICGDSFFLLIFYSKIRHFNVEANTLLYEIIDFGIHPDFTDSARLAGQHQRPSCGTSIFTIDCL